MYLFELFADDGLLIVFNKVQEEKKSDVLSGCRNLRICVSILSLKMS